MLKILVAEDDIMQSRSLVFAIKSILPDSKITATYDYKTALSKLNTEHYDLLFLDIILSDINPDENGISLAHKIRSMEHYLYTPIIFVTIKESDITDAVNEIHCHSYILKPIATDSLRKVISNVIGSPVVRPVPIKVCDARGITYIIHPDNLLYIFSSHRTIYYVTDDKTYQTPSKPFEHIQAKLGNNFIRCHRGYIVNINKVKNYDKTENVIQINDDLIPIGRTHKKEFTERMNKLSL